MIDAWVVCPPGLEPLCCEELRALGVRNIQPGTGGVACTMSTVLLYGANLRLRTATRILVRAGSFRALTFPELIHGVRDLEWSRWLRENATGVRLSVSSSKSKLFHTGAIAERVSEAMGIAVSEDEDDPMIVVRVARDVVTVSVDSTGTALHHRPWRVASHKAPMRPTLAAGLLLASGWDRAQTLVDPFCGSGTIAIEAALLASRRAPNLGRSFALQQWPTFKRAAWRGAVAAAEGAAVERRPGVIIAADRDQGAVNAAIANARAAEVTIEVRHAAISALSLPEEPGLLVSNPPYGIRLGERDDLRDLYDSWGATLRKRGHGWQVVLITNDLGLAGRLNVPFNELLRTTNGGVPVRFVRGLVAGAVTAAPAHE
ncbi:MAG: methylase [Acidimicrobiia bacterium]|nr:methylase [Acidimicrobiia bacterium]